jgi:hypothetical protein
MKRILYYLRIRLFYLLYFLVAGIFLIVMANSLYKHFQK